MAGILALNRTAMGLLYDTVTIRGGRINLTRMQCSLEADSATQRLDLASCSGGEYSRPRTARLALLRQDEL